VFNSLSSPRLEVGHVGGGVDFMNAGIRQLACQNRRSHVAPQDDMKSIIKRYGEGAIIHGGAGRGERKTCLGSTQQVAWPLVFHK
jgi:hypothetical protein